MAVFKGRSGVGKNDRVNEVLAMGVVGEWWLKYGLVDHVDDLDWKISWQFDVNVGADEMNELFILSSKQYSPY